MEDEGFAWPSYVDFLSVFAFLLILFLAATVYLISDVEGQRRRAEGIKAVGASFYAAGIGNVVEGDRIRIPLGDRLNFPVQGSELTDSARTFLGQLGRSIVAEVVKQRSQGTPVGRVVVEGHADRLRFRQDEFGNWQLSVLRAMEVLKFLYLCDDCGYDVKTLRACLVLRGEGDIGATNLVGDEMKTGRAGDRRVDIVLDFAERER